MKRILFILTIVVFINFTYAQTINSISTTTNTETLLNNKEVQEKVKEQLINDENLTNKALNYLKTNSDTKAIVRKYGGDSDGTSRGLLKSLLTDTKVSNTVMDWIANDPEVYNQVMSLIGM